MKTVAMLRWRAARVSVGLESTGRPDASRLRGLAFTARAHIRVHFEAGVSSHHLIRRRFSCLGDEFLETWGLLDSRRDTMHDLWVELFRIVPLLLCAVLPVVVGSSSQSDRNGWHRK